MLDRGLRRSFPAPGRGPRRSDRGARRRARAARRDLRDLPTFTIDPDDARDFDDAVSAEAIDGDAIRLWVHIADVSAYARPGGAIDAEAQRRGTSVYVPGAVEPMLPEALSNRACSLRPGEDKLAVTVEMDMAGTDVRRVEFHRTVIRSDERLTYGQVDEVFAGRARAEEPWGEPLERRRARWPRRCAARREERGALEVDSREPTFEFDSDGHVTGVEHEAQTESHTLIEELMILANEQVAGYLADRKLPALYRVHEKPDPQSVELMVAQLASLDIPTPALPAQHEPPAGGRRGGGGLAPGRRRGAAQRPRARLVRLAGAALAQAGLLHAAQPRPRRPGERALLPLHLADPPLSRPGGAPRAAERPGPGRHGAARRTSSTRPASRPAPASARR